MSILKKAKKRLWIYNCGIDNDWIQENHGVKKINDKYEQYTFNCQAELVLFLAGEDDILPIVKKPDEEFLNDMRKLGFSRPVFELLPNENLPISKIIAANKNILQNLRGRVTSDYEYTPYILSIYDELNAQDLQLNLLGASSQVAEQVDSKITARRIAEQLNLPLIDGYICKNKSEIEEGYRLLKEKGYTSFVMKEPYSSAGKGVYFIKNEKQFYMFLKMLKMDVEEKFEIIIEGWVNKKKDINYQIEISEDGNVEMIAITEQIIAVTSYKGTLYPAELSEEQFEKYQQYAQCIGKYLYEIGYTGIVGIDSIIIQDDIIIPVIEFNARLNQSTFFYPIAKKMEKFHRSSLVRSFDVQTKGKLDYKRLKKLLLDNGLYFDDSTNTGVLILNSTCLSCYQKAENGLYHSRLFLACIFKNEYQEMYQRLKELIKKLVNISMED